MEAIDMSIHHSHSMTSNNLLRAVAVLVICALSSLTVQAQKKSDKAVAAPTSVQPKRAAFDISRIVWPVPPEIARVKFESILTGQKIDWAGLESKKKPKQSWMDRLAGAQPDRQVKDVESKVGF